MTVYYAVSAGCIVLVGGFIDRHGPRGLLTYGVVSMAVAVATLGIITAPWQLFAVYLVLATSWSCLSLTGISSTILPWFGRRQGVAMTLAHTGASVGGMVLVPVLVALVLHRGFPFATMAAGSASLVIGLPLVLFVIRGRPLRHEVAGEPVFGLVAGTVQIGVALGPGLTGFLHDALGSYQPVLWCLVGLESVAVVSVLWGRALRERPALADHVDNGRGRA